LDLLSYTTPILAILVFYFALKVKASGVDNIHIKMGIRTASIGLALWIISLILLLFHNS
jgi:uncharacterized membrane protein